MLRLSDVTAGYGAPVLHGINLEIKTGEILAIVGLNGSGKSSLLKTCLGLIEPMAGEVTFEGQNLKTLSLRERARKISLLEAQTKISFAMTVQELLELSARHLEPRESTELVGAAIEATEIKELIHRNVLELSSGESKRAFIAHALASGSAILLLDEPFSHLDWRHQSDLVSQIKRWRDIRRTTFVLAVHELSWAVQIADRVCALDQGKVLATGPAEEVFLSPRFREVFAFQSRIDENPIDGSKRLTLGRR